MPRTPRDLANQMAARRKPTDGFRRETFALPLEEARARARSILKRYPKAAYMTEVESWRDLGDGRIGLEQMERTKPGLILLDLLMPEMDGFEFLAELRRQERWRSVPVVVVTAKNIDAADRTRLNGYVETILEKGAFTREELLQELRDLVRARLRPDEARA